MKKFGNEDSVIAEFAQIKEKKKEQLADYVYRKEKIRLLPGGIVYAQVKRLHEYKRQLMTAFAILEIYEKLKKGDLEDFRPAVFLFGAKSALNLETLLGCAPQVIIDTGEAKKGAKEDLDALQEQLGIPVIFIEAKLSDYGAAYERLGELLSMEERGGELSTYCTDVYNMTVTTMENIPENERVRMAYLLGDNGLNAIAKTSFQAAVVDMVADNVVVVDDVSGKGNGNEISLEQIALWNPDLIVFQTGSIYDTVGDDPAWAGIAAIDSGNYYQVPNVPYCWLNNPPTVNQLMGLQWLPRLLYPDAFDDSIEDVTRAYFHTMYNYDLSDTELADLIKDAVPKA